MYWITIYKQQPRSKVNQQVYICVCSKKKQRMEKTEKKFNLTFDPLSYALGFQFARNCYFPSLRNIICYTEFQVHPYTALMQKFHGSTSCVSGERKKYVKISVIFYFDQTKL